MSAIFRSVPARLGLTAFSLFLTFSFVSRLVLLLISRSDFTWDLSIPVAFAAGFLFDVSAATFVLVPWVILGVITPRWLLKSGSGSVLLAAAMLVFGGIMIFITTAEWFFWDEFSARFNFIAVDYLVWTQEVWGNISESYPMPLIISGIALGSGLMVWLMHRAGWFRWVIRGGGSWKDHCAWTATALAIPALVATLVSQSGLPAFPNQFNGELAKNGCWSFFTAMRQMELDYDTFYITLPRDQALAAAKQQLVTPEEPAASSTADDLRRSIAGGGKEKRWNVILICMESMSRSFMSCSGNKDGLTPNLDRIANNSVSFENLYATGTRTVRGMEALTLGLPPTPGQAIIYRPEGVNLTTTFSPFLDRGYDCAFFYGGDGRFDYMNRYFSTAGCRIMDVGAWNPGDTSYKTAWGACDEDLFGKTIQQADECYAAGRPFHYFCMTTSNHRPFGFPSGRIDMAANGKRKPAVKYADWALGRFLDDAGKRPWFKDTLFVIVADHCASSAGKTELDVTKYRIPGMIYNPSLVAPRKIQTLSSQVDVMPTMFGILGWNHETLGYGHDQLAPSAADRPGRAFVSNYQKLGLLTPDGIAILSPNRKYSAHACDLETGEYHPLDPAMQQRLVHDAGVFYQSASFLFGSGALKRNKPIQIVSQR